LHRRGNPANVHVRLRNVGETVLILRRVLWVVTFVLTTTLVVDVARADMVRIDGRFQALSLGKHLELAYDPTGQLTVDDVVAGKLLFEPSKQEVPSFGYRSGTEWARFRVAEEPGVRTEPHVLEVSYPSTDDVQLFRLEGSGAEALGHAGDRIPHSKWPLRTRMPSFVIAREGDYLVRVSSSAAHQLPMTLETREHSNERRAREGVVQALYYGALLAMVFYNALIWIAAGLRLYGYYVGFLLSYGTCSMTFGGVLFATILGETPRLNEHLLIPSLAASGICSIAFAVALLDVGAWGKRHQAFARILSGAFAVAAFASFVVPYSIGIRFAYLVVLIWVPFMFSVGISGLRGGKRTSRWFLLAWTSFLVGCLVNALRLFGWLPTNDVTANTLQVGSFFEFTLLSYALADRIKDLQAEATQNAELAAQNALAAEEATKFALEEQSRINLELHQMDKLKDTFLANTSHELRTPLNGILGLVETTLSGSVGAVPGPVKRNLELVRASGRRLATLVNDILDFSKLREKAVTLREQPVALRAVVELTLQTLTPLAGDKRLRLLNEVPETCGVRADENRLQQILTNLVGNAIKFTHEGHVLVRAETTGERVRVVVQDTGIGIPKKAQARIFESFEQADGSTSREYGGTGLGLSVTKQLVELHGGTVGVDSEPGRGSAFTFDLAADLVPTGTDNGPRFAPQRASSTPAPNEVDGIAAPVSASPQGLRVLVVDDEPINREVLAQHLGAKGFEVMHAQDGVQAIERIEADKPDVVLLDVMMPRKTGYDVLEAVRPKLEASELPVLLLTAKAQESDLSHGFSLGASDYLLKPVSFVELDARLGHHAKLVRAGRVLAATLEGLEQTVVERTSELRRALEALDLDLREAKRFQEMTMQAPSKLGDFRVETFVQPCAVVGGDFFDVLLREDGSVRVFLADATGHGVQAALRTMVIKTAYDAIKTAAARPSDCLRALNDALVAAYPEFEAKTDAVCVDVHVGTDGDLHVRASTAGAMPVLVGDGVGAHELRTRGAPLGVGAGLAYIDQEASFESCARVCFFTDGISEQEDTEKRAYEIERIEAIVARESSLLRVRDELVSSWHAFRGAAPQGDDATVLVLAKG
jgi:signal transduction histidine kinase/DNA-binding response OmpR family regulator